MQKKFPLLLVAALLLLSASLPVLAQDEVVFGVVLVGPREDRGWSQSHYEAGLYVEEKLPNSRMVFFESLNPDASPETTLLDVVTFMVQDEGAQVIFTTSDAFEEDTDTVAERFPDVVFINITGSNVLDTAGDGVPENVGNFNGLMEAPRLMAGCAAALETETGSIGYLGALINPETRRLSASSYLGARYCYENYRGIDPDELAFTVTWIGFWFEIPGVTLNPVEVVNDFIDGGADVIISGIDTTEAVEVAGVRMSEGDRAFGIPYGNINGCSARGEETEVACLGVAYYNWGPAYLNTINEVLGGTWEQSWDWLPPDWNDINSEDTSIIGYLNGGGISEEGAAQLDMFYEEMAAFMSDPANEGKVFLWEGPLNLQDGTELAADGEFVDLIDIWFLPQLLEGMVGASE